MRWMNGKFLPYIWGPILVVNFTPMNANILCKVFLLHNGVWSVIGLVRGEIKVSLIKPQAFIVGLKYTSGRNVSLPLRPQT